MSKYFITTKLVEAKEMLAIDAETAGYRTNDVVSEMPGYEIIYFDGYKSWCPKTVFDKNAIKLEELNSFNIICGNHYPDYVKRMFEEQDQLQEKVVKLMTFINSTKFTELDKIQQDNLNKQYLLMLGYLNILRERIYYEISIPVK